tara:strand:- start:252 stop:692 length:441 start_codon:yes stop_codon:yes gene_type:complete
VAAQQVVVDSGMQVMVVAQYLMEQLLLEAQALTVQSRPEDQAMEDLVLVLLLVQGYLDKGIMAGPVQIIITEAVAAVKAKLAIQMELDMVAMVLMLGPHGQQLPPRELVVITAEEEVVAENTHNLIDLAETVAEEEVAMALHMLML